MKTLLVILAVLLDSGGVAHARVQAAPDISGAWDLSVTTSRGTESAVLALKKEGDKYTGAITGPQGQVIPAQATVKEKSVTISIVVQSQGAPTTITFSGTIDGDAMAGSGEFGSRGTGTWSATRAQRALDVSGTWNFEVQTPIGTGTPTFTLKQEGNTITGRYKGQLGEADVTGSIKGSEVTLALDGTIEGNTVRITYTGTVDNDAIKGKVTFGTLGEGTFTGTRKAR